MRKICDIISIEKTKLCVTFENGVKKECDISQFMGKGAFRELKEESLFKQFKNTGFSVEWPNDIDLSSDTLYYIGK